MHKAIAQMMARYDLTSRDAYTGAIREIIQEIALLGLWRAKFFEHAAFYGGTSLRILHGLDRFSEDLDFSLVEARPDYDLGRYLSAVELELRAYGFAVEAERKKKARSGAVQSAFLKANTLRELLLVGANDAMVGRLQRNQLIRIKIEVDTDPPPGFKTEVRFLLSPMAFSVRSYSLPDMFAGKMHAVLCRKWKNRVKGRDWYDLVWYAANHPELHLAHLEARMRQSGHLSNAEKLTAASFRRRLREAIGRLDVAQARAEAVHYINRPGELDVWSRDFFASLVSRIKIV